MGAEMSTGWWVVQEMDPSVRTMGGYILSMEQPRTPILLLKARHFSPLLPTSDEKNRKNAKNLVNARYIFCLWNSHHDPLITVRLCVYSPYRHFSCFTVTLDKKEKSNRCIETINGYKFHVLGRRGGATNICLQQICYCHSCYRVFVFVFVLLFIFVFVFVFVFEMGRAANICLWRICCCHSFHPDPLLCDMSSAVI